MPQVVDAPFAHRFLQRLQGAANAHDAHAVAALCCADVVWDDPAAPHTLHGCDAVQRFQSEIMFPALPDTHIVLIDGPYPTGPASGYSTWPPSGRGHAKLDRHRSNSASRRSM